MKSKANIIVILCLLDIITTLCGLSLGIKEANPLMAFLITTSMGVFLKFLLTSMVALWLYLRKAKRTLTFITVLMSLVVINNIIAILFA